VSFVEKVTRDGGPDFVPTSERIAVFDNDGTLWSEQPMYFQLLFVFDRIRAMAKDHPEWQTRQPYKAVIEGDMKTLAASGEEGVVELMMATHTGMPIEDFTAIVNDWLATAASQDQAALQRDDLPADARGPHLPPGPWVQDVHRLGRRGGVHAALG
jgi:FMN phosphatase YigB (HAD superfamily)